MSINYKNIHDIRIHKKTNSGKKVSTRKHKEKLDKENEKRKNKGEKPLPENTYTCDKWSQEYMADLLGVSLSKYKRIETSRSKKPPFDEVGLFLNLARVLEVDPIDLVSPDCEFRGQFSSINIKDFKTEDGFNDYLYNLEKEYGRSTVFNMFPSTIYYDNGTSSLKRYDLLSNEPEKNEEYYPIDAVLNFCFNINFNISCSFSNKEKLIILDKIITSFSKDEKGKGHIHKQLHIFDPNTIKYFYDAPTCLFFSKKDTVLIPSPTHKNKLIVIRSPDFIKNTSGYMKLKGKMLNTGQSVELLKAIGDCLKKNKTVDEFINELKIKLDDNHVGYVNFVWSSLPNNLKDSVQR